MIQPFLKQSGFALAAMVLTIGGVIAAPYQAGSAVEPFTAMDQHGKPFTLNPAKTRFLLVSHDMESGKKANAALSALDREFLGSKQAVYVANIHGMPSVGRMFAIPKMKKHTHRIILCDDAALIAKFPAQKNKVTVLTLDSGKISSIRYWEPGTESPESVLK